MYLQLSILSGGGYVSTMLDHKTSLACKQVSSDEILQMVKDYTSDRRYTVSSSLGEEESHWVITESNPKLETEFSRYKQDCRKRALDLAHGHFQFCSRNETDKTFSIIDHADIYYNWLISIPEK